MALTAEFTWVDDYDFLAKHKIEEAIPWAMLKGNDDGMMSIGHERAEAAGLEYRPIATTVRDTRAWWLTVPEARRKAAKFTISVGAGSGGTRRLARAKSLTAVRRRCSTRIGELPISRGYPRSFQRFKARPWPVGRSRS